MYFAREKKGQGGREGVRKGNGRRKEGRKGRKKYLYTWRLYLHLVVY